MPSGVTMAKEHSSDVVDKVLQLMLSILSGLHSYNDMSTISSCSLQWAPVFDLKNSRCCLERNPCASDVFLFFSSGLACLT